MLSYMKIIDILHISAGKVKKFISNLFEKEQCLEFKKPASVFEVED